MESANMAAPVNNGVSGAISPSWKQFDAQAPWLHCAYPHLSTSRSLIKVLINYESFIAHRVYTGGTAERTGPVCRVAIDIKMFNT